MQFYYAPGSNVEYYRQPVLEALEGIEPGGKEHTHLLLECLPVSRVAGVGTWPSLARSRAIAAVMRLVQDKRIAPEKVVKPLLGAMNDQGCRIQAIKALGALGTDAAAAVPTLTVLKRDPDQMLRDAAIEALKKIE
jgi:hypothetical protein